MKMFSTKLVIFFSFLVMAGLASASAWLNAAGAAGAVVMIVFIHLDNLDFCKKLDRVMAGDKDVKF